MFTLSVSTVSTCFEALSIFPLICDHLIHVCFKQWYKELVHTWSNAIYYIFKYNKHHHKV